MYGRNKSSSENGDPKHNLSRCTEGAKAVPCKVKPNWQRHPSRCQRRTKRQAKNSQLHGSDMCKWCNKRANPQWRVPKEESWLEGLQLKIPISNEWFGGTILGNPHMKIGTFHDMSKTGMFPHGRETTHHWRIKRKPNETPAHTAPGRCTRHQPEHQSYHPPRLWSKAPVKFSKCPILELAHHRSGAVNNPCNGIWSLNLFMGQLWKITQSVLGSSHEFNPPIQRVKRENNRQLDPISYFLCSIEEPDIRIWSAVSAWNHGWNHGYVAPRAPLRRASKP